MQSNLYQILHNQIHLITESIIKKDRIILQIPKDPFFFKTNVHSLRAHNLTNIFARTLELQSISLCKYEKTFLNLATEN